MMKIAYEDDDDDDEKKVATAITPSKPRQHPLHSNSTESLVGLSEAFKRLHRENSGYLALPYLGLYTLPLLPYVLSSSVVIRATDIHELNLEDNKLTDLSPFRDVLPHLTILICSKNQLSSLGCDEMPLLKELRCNRNQLTRLPSKMPLLRVLSAWDNQLTSIDGHWPLIEDVMISGNKIIDVYNFKGCEWLQRLSIDSMPIDLHMHCLRLKLSKIGKTILRETHVQSDTLSYTTTTTDYKKASWSSFRTTQA